MNDAEKTQRILGLIREVSKAAAEESNPTPSSYFYPMGAPSLKLVQRIQAVIDGRED